jgi:hypothetical protein
MLKHLVFVKKDIGHLSLLTTEKLEDVLIGIGICRI